ncbi:hypothetical protein Tco_0726308 [Tanacetum coccineum]|uniref:Transposase (Putative), gypsy type n=1 Tax=Tanacetum coccineum TaxID=301880 RepID=A0ABQ4YG44_9ASTR
MSLRNYKRQIKEEAILEEQILPLMHRFADRFTDRKDSAPHLTARQEQTVKLLESHKASFCRYPECFLCLVGLSPYYPFDENSYPDFKYPDGSEMGLFNFIKTANPRKVQAVEVQKGDDQVTLLESTRHCFMHLVIPAAGGSSSDAAAEVSALTEEGQEDVAPKEAYLELADPDEGTTAVRQSEEEVVMEQPKKVKKKRLLKQSDVLPAKRLRTDHPTLISDTGGKTLAGLEQIRLVGSRLPDSEQLTLHSVAPSSQESKGFLGSSAQTNLRIHTTVESSSILGIPIDTNAAAITSTRAVVNPDLAGPSQPEESEVSDDFFYEPPTLDHSEVKRWYVPRWNITNDSLLEDGFSCRTLVDCVAPPAFFSALRTMDYDQLYTKFNVGAARLQEEKDLEILRLKSQLAEKEAEAAELIRLRDQVSSLSGEKSALIAEVSVLKVSVTQKDHDISLLNSRAACLASTLDDAKDTLGHALGRAVDFGMQEGLEAGYEHGVAGRNLSVVDAYNPKVAKASYINVVKALEDVDFPLVNLLKSKKDAGMDEVLDCFLLDGPLAGLPKAACLQPCIEQLSIPIHHAGDNTAVGETSLSFTLMNVHVRAKGAKKHVAALRQLMMDIVFAPLSSQT